MTRTLVLQKISYIISRILNGGVRHRLEGLKVGKDSRGCLPGRVARMLSVKKGYISTNISVL